MDLVSKLKFVVENKFERLTYGEAIEILKNSTPNKKGKFQYPIEGWGTDLQSEHERYLVEKHFQKPMAGLLLLEVSQYYPPGLQSQLIG